MKNRLTIIIGVAALLIVGAAVLGYYLGLQEYSDAEQVAQGKAGTGAREELKVELAPNGMPMDLYLEEQEKVKKESSQPIHSLPATQPKKSLNILTDVKTIIAREEMHKERVKELKKIAEEAPDSPQAISKESIKRMEEQGLSEQ